MYSWLRQWASKCYCSIDSSLSLSISKSLGAFIALATIIVSICPDCYVCSSASSFVCAHTLSCSSLSFSFSFLFLLFSLTSLIRFNYCHFYCPLDLVGYSIRRRTCKVKSATVADCHYHSIDHCLQPELLNTTVVTATARRTKQELIKWRIKVGLSGHCKCAAAIAAVAAAVATQSFKSSLIRQGIRAA